MKLNASQPDRSREEAAYSLPETIVAVLVVGVMLVSLYAGFSSGFSVVQSAREDLRATQILVQRMEALRLYRWSELLNTTNYLKPTFVEYDDPSGAMNPTSAKIYSGYLSRAPAGVPNLLAVTLTVCWTNHHGNAEVVRSRQMQTYVARYGMQNEFPGK